MRLTLLGAIVLAGLSAHVGAQALRCEHTWFSDGAVASRRCVAEDGSHGTVQVFDMTGAAIGEWGLLLRPRVANLELQFHPSGMVRRVVSRWQPDGGVQWYRSVTTYDRDGNVIGFREEGHDMHERIRAIEHEG